MRRPTLSLALATIAFGGSTLYLWQQLVLERERAAQVEASKLQLQARLDEVEKAREQLAQARANNGAFVSGSFGNLSPPPPPRPAPAGQAVVAGESEPGWVSAVPHQRTPAMEKMMRWQVRADLKRQYANLGEELGLSQEDARTLVDMLIEQQLTMLGGAEELPWQTDPAAAQRRIQEKIQADLVAIDQFLGSEKAAALREFQNSMPARHEYDSLVHQLAGVDVVLTPEQNQRLRTAYLEEYRRVPTPDFQGGDPATYQKSLYDWQADLATRLSSRAQSILDPAQLTAFNELQENQREMQRQFSSMSWAVATPTAPGTVVNVMPSSGVAVTVQPADPPPPPPDRDRTTRER